MYQHHHHDCDHHRPLSLHIIVLSSILLFSPPKRPRLAKTVLITFRALSVIHQALGLQKSFSTSDILSGAAYHEGGFCRRYHCHSQDQPQHLNRHNYDHPHQQQLLGLSHGRHTRSELFLLECGAGGLNSWGR